MYNTLHHTCTYERLPEDEPTVSKLKKQLKGRHFSSNGKVIAAAETWLDGQSSEFFLVACKSYSNGLRSVLSFVGEFVE